MMENENNIVTLDTPADELEQRLISETDIDELKNVINLFNLNIKKKDIIRTNKLSNLQDLVTDQMSERLEKNAGAFSNKDLIDYFKIIQDSINKADTSLDTVDTPAIQFNQQVNLNVQSKNELDKDSRDRVAMAVQSILAKMKQPQSQEETEQEENVEPDIIETEYTELEDKQENG